VAHQRRQRLATDAEGARDDGAAALSGTAAAAVMESFFATVKKEKGDRFPSYSDAKMALFDYIEAFYNQRRRHSTLAR
jgi:hypothetical protein